MLLADSRDPVSVSDIVQALAVTGGSLNWSEKSPLLLPAPPAPAPSPAPEWVSRVEEHLRDKRYADAVQFVLDARASGTIAPDEDLTGKLVESGGAAAASKLVSAFARFPCQKCGKGTDPCAICRGTGIRAERVVCEHCIGSGMIRCDFCGGTGLGPYDVVPITLRYPVLVRRAEIATTQAKSLLAWPLPSSEIELVNAVWNFNKLLAVMEGAVSAAGLLAAHDSRIADGVSVLWKNCQHHAEHLDAAMRAALLKLSEVCGSITQSRDSGDSSIAVRKSVFYEKLATAPTFRGTCLHHPFLRATPLS
jgi:hypothetical protein